MLDTTTSVREFYERYPYPPPVEHLDGYRSAWNNRQRRRHDHHLRSPELPFRDDHSILIAGCGTSQAAKYAMRWPSARVTGIDFARTSVERTEALKRTYHLDNLDIHQLPVERAPELGTRFDHIVCTGVLHHLEEPLAGLRALRGVLSDDGTMLLMLYAPYGRAGVYLIQEFCRRVGIGATDAGLRELAAALDVLPRGHPLERLVRDAPDFRNEASLGDALLHPRDRAYSVSQLFEFLEAAGLAFNRWVRQAPYSARCGSLARIPYGERIARLSASEESAAAELFRGTMVRHSCVARPLDDTGHTPELRFDRDACLDYVPIRAPEAICVEERLPPGSAGVLINRAHDFHDLFLPVDAQEKRWVDAIDGERTLREIAEGQAVRARAFFERLWWHDQVVFDASVAMR